MDGRCKLFYPILQNRSGDGLNDFLPMYCACCCGWYWWPWALFSFEPAGGRPGAGAGVGLRAVWARLTGRPITPWTTRIDPRAGWSTVYRSSTRWRATGAAPGGADEAPSSVPVHLRPLPGADEVTDVQPREPGEK